MSGRGLRPRRRAALDLAAPLVLIAAAWAVGAGGGPSLRSEVTLTLCTLVIVLGLQLFVGGSGIYSFGHLAFAAIGAYTAAFLTLPGLYAALETPALPQVIAGLEVAPLVAVLAAAAICALLAALVGPALLRTSTLAIPISTFAFLIVVYNVIANWEALTAGSGGLIAIPTSTGPGTAAIAAALAALVALAFRYSASGYRLQASREDEVAARALGVRVTRERLIALVASAAICGVGGALSAQQSGVLTPQSFYFAATVTTLTMLVLGGARSVLGAVCGALLVGAVTEALRSLEEGADLFGLVSVGATPGLSAIGLGAILLATMIWRPQGLTAGREAGDLLRLGDSARSAAGQPRPSPRASAAARPAEGPQDGLRARGISVSFAGLEVLRDVDLELGRGEVLGLIGPNGAGKTTLVNVLSGFQRPEAGAVWLDGVPISGLSPDARARAGLARSFQSSLPFAHLSARENVAVGALAVGRRPPEAVARAEEILARLGLEAEAGRAAGTLAPGARRLLGIGRALAGEPRHLLLDEPAAGLNEAESEELVRALRGVNRDFGCGILLIEHDMDVVMELCPRVQVLDAGATLTVGEAARVRADPAVLEAYLGSSFTALADA